MNINEQFKNKICINLDRRLDRWETVQAEFQKHDIQDVERFSATDGSLLTDIQQFGKSYQAEFGGTLSHYNAIKYAKQNKFKNIVIFEDDVIFIENFNSLFDWFIENPPAKWDVIFFGGNHTGGFTKYNDFYNKIFRTYAIHAYIVNSTAYDKILAHLEKSIELVKNSTEKLMPSVAADYFLAQIQPDMNFYSFSKHLAWQSESFSDIQQTVVNYDFLKN
jgi:GR25 family glycosyltransferase involved in LPS biosynthesis